MRIVIDRDLCQGHQVCKGEAPEVFDLGADGKVAVLQERPADELLERVREAARNCPTGAISLVT